MRDAAVPSGYSSPSVATVLGNTVPGSDSVLSPEALAFVVALTRQFRAPLDGLLAERAARRVSGAPLDFLPETAPIRNSDWRVAPPPADLVRRLVEITGPVERKMIINALNSGADVFMADFGDSTSPTWDNLIRGQKNLADAVRGTIKYQHPRTGKTSRLYKERATLMVCPRGLHLEEAHVLIDGRPVPAALFDFGLYLFHNAATLLSRGSGPYFYLSKLESHDEAAWWNEVFVEAQKRLHIPRGSIRATVLIETLPAAFQMHEILYALREHSAGLNSCRWDYIFSTIKSRRHDPTAVLPDRSQITMTQPFLRAYTQLLVQTCHRRGAHAIGDQAANIPIRTNAEANAEALAQVIADKSREVQDGHDGTWIAHPELVCPARKVFLDKLTGPNQLHQKRDDLVVTRDDLLQIPAGSRTEAGLRLNIRVAVLYLEAWLGGTGCVPLYDKMEDAATAEISRAQVWQWVHHQVTLDDGRPVTPDLVRMVGDAEMLHILREVGPDRFTEGHFADARALFETLVFASELDEFLTTTAYPALIAPQHSYPVTPPGDQASRPLLPR